MIFIRSSTRWAKLKSTGGWELTLLRSRDFAASVRGEIFHPSGRLEARPLCFCRQEKGLVAGMQRRRASNGAAGAERQLMRCTHTRSTQNASGSACYCASLLPSLIQLAESSTACAAFPPAQPREFVFALDGSVATRMMQRHLSERLPRPPPPGAAV